MGAYFFVMAAFCAAALLVGHYWLAAGEMAVTVVTFLLYVLDRTRRERKIQQYIQSASNTLEASSGGEAPLPAVMVRLGDGDIVWGNHRFSELTGYADTMTQLRLEEVLPDFTLDWLTAGKTESPHDAILGNRRYRVYGTTIAAHVKQHRMEQAALLLVKSQLDIAAVAQAVGYESPSRFTAAFKETYGVLPTEYRKQRAAK
ncbi:MAG: AraC family transcriptional regulator [Clostridiales bacterium]|nr:AraC family transcriptional regulator [Clostridiales bacterium]